MGIEIFFFYPALLETILTPLQWVLHRASNTLHKI